MMESPTTSSTELFLLNQQLQEQVRILQQEVNELRTQPTPNPEVTVNSPLSPNPEAETVNSPPPPNPGAETANASTATAESRTLTVYSPLPPNPDEETVNSPPPPNPGAETANTSVAVATAESATLQPLENVLTHTASALQGAAVLVETVGEIMDRFEAMLKKHIPKDDLTFEKWNELASAQIKLRRRTYLLAATLKERVEQLKPSIKRATTVDDLKEIISFVTDKQMRKRLNTMSEECIEFGALLRKFDQILQKRSASVGWYKGIGPCVGLLLAGLGLMGVTYVVIANPVISIGATELITDKLASADSLLGVAKGKLVGAVTGGASGTLLSASAFFFKHLTKFNEIMDRLKKAQETTLKMQDLLDQLQVAFDDIKLLKPILKDIQKLLYCRFEKISGICEKIIPLVQKI